MLPAHPRGRQPGPAVGGTGRRHHRLRRHRPLALHRRPEDRRLRHRVGRHLRTPAQPLRRLDAGAQARPHPRRRGHLDVRAHRRPRRPRRPQGRHRPGPRRRLRGPRARRDLHRRPGRPPAPQPGHRLRRQDPARRGQIHVAARTARLRRRRVHPAAGHAARPPPVSTTASARPTPERNH
ncbi:hypothetical protein SGPA1_10665 [Streptomyces misionensis JCM 4497]